MLNFQIYQLSVWTGLLLSVISRWRHDHCMDASPDYYDVELHILNCTVKSRALNSVVKCCLLILEK